MLDKTKWKEAIAEYIQGCNQGYFVTIDTQYTTDKHKINRAFLDKFSLEINEIFRPLKIYAFGRNFRRYEEAIRSKQTLPALPVSFEYKIKGVAAYEIGKEERRLHLHAMLLHNGSCNRTVMEVESRLREICCFNKCTRLKGRNAQQVKLYDANRKDNLICYLTKSTEYFGKYYDGFCNIDFI